MTRYLTFGSLFVLLVALHILGGCTKGSVSAPPGEEDHHEEQQEGGRTPHTEKRIALSLEAVAAAGLTTAVASYASLHEEIEATAVIKPNEYRMTHVTPRIKGKAIRVDAELGDVVKSGTVLAELDSIELGAKKAAFLQARVNLEVGRRNYQREERLFKQHISSEKEYLEAKGEFERSEAAYRTARESLRLIGLSDAEIDKVDWGGSAHSLSHFPLIAPFGGTIIERHITIGELIEPEEIPFTIADLSTVWIVVDIYEKDVGHVSKGTQVRVSLDAYPGEVFLGSIAYVSHTLDPRTRTAQARVVLDNRHGRLRPGMFARATIAVPRTDSRKVLTVPTPAIQRIRGEPVVFVEEQPGTYEPREVETGQQVGSQVEIRSGISEGEHVVTDGSFYLKSALLKEEMAGHGH